jgi:glutathione synthase/RimK-type ligase-like ATP-grasp enzyme
LASNKIHQLKLAQKLKLPRPDYLITNDPKAVAWFRRRHASVIVKAIGCGYLTYGTRHFKFYTRRLDELGRDFTTALRYGPMIFQEEIDKHSEVRVTIVDGACFSLRVNCVDLPGNTIDVRKIDFKKHKERFFKAHGVEQIEAWSKLISTALGLSYSALDWAIGRSGKAYFLECNPLGSFKWSELCGGFNITNAIANSLYVRASHRGGGGT